MTISAVDFDIRLEVALQRDEDDFIWFHPRAAALPGAAAGGDSEVLMTLQKHLAVSDHYSGLHFMLSSDMGRTWTPPVLPPELDWRWESDDIAQSLCDVTPSWHPPTGQCLALGFKIRYNRSGGQIQDKRLDREAAWSAYDPRTQSWKPWSTIDLGGFADRFYAYGPGCAQWLVRPDGQLLVPVYNGTGSDPCFGVAVMRCAFDGQTIECLDVGHNLTLDVPRGLCEPSMAEFAGRFFLTLRNDEAGYVTAGDDGLDFAPIRRWAFDDGSDLGSYNTQQHWLVHHRGLFLTYTRRGANNDHVTRHRAPLFIAQVDPDRLCVIRETERILIPEHGVPMGNFGAAAISPNESWVTTAEFMWPAWNDAARRLGAAGRVFVARVLWSEPNENGIVS